MSARTLALATAVAFLALSSPAQADLFDQLNKTMDSIDNAINETENTVNSVRGGSDKDLNDTEPAAGNARSSNSTSAAPQQSQSSNNAPAPKAAPAPQIQTEQDTSRAHRVSR